MSDVDAVAEAIRVADDNAPRGVIESDYYQALANAAIGALGLVEEMRPRGLYRGADPDLKYEERRVVSPWVRVD